MGPGVPRRPRHRHLGHLRRRRLPARLRHVLLQAVRRRAPRLRRPLRLGREDDRALPQEPRRPAHQDADLLRPAVVSPRHQHCAPLPRARENRVRHRHQPDQRPGLRADQHRHQDDRVQRPAGREGIRLARQDDQQGRGLPALPAPGIRAGARREDLIRNTAVAVLATCFALNMFGRGLGDTYVVFVLPLEREYGWTRSQLTSVYSIYLLMHGFTSPFVGLIFDRLGPRWVYTTGILFMCAAFFLAAGLSNLWQFYLFVGGMVGVGVSLMGMVPGSALIARWFRERLSTAIGIAFSAAGVGTILFVPLTQYLVGHHDWRFAYRVLGGALLLMVPIVAFVLPWQRFYAGHPERPHAAKLKPGEEGWTLRKAMC